MICVLFVCLFVQEEERRRKEELAQKKRQLELEKIEKEKREKQAEKMSGGSKLSNVLKAKEDMQKSPEQLEAEKREILSERIVRLDLDGKSKDDLAGMVLWPISTTLFTLFSTVHYKKVYISFFSRLRNSSTS